MLHAAGEFKSELAGDVRFFAVELCGVLVPYQLPSDENNYGFPPGCCKHDRLQFVRLNLDISPGFAQDKRFLHVIPRQAGSSLEVHEDLTWFRYSDHVMHVCLSVCWGIKNYGGEGAERREGCAKSFKITIRRWSLAIQYLKSQIRSLNCFYSPPQPRRSLTDACLRARR